MSAKGRRNTYYRNNIHNDFFGYIRVSTPRQGTGVSLDEQREAIARCAEQNGLLISQWFVEQETASKRGRPVFTAMLRLLRQGKAAGVIIHKIDRSARNLGDWNDVTSLVDLGIDLRLATENLDLRSRGGRLAADIQAVVAADYSRNLRDEVKKGLYGRLKQGVYPFRAPVGYRDCGAGRPKEPDPVTAPLVAKGYELYATARYSLAELRDELHRRGLRTRSGGRVSINGIATMLKNPFYIGVIRIFRNGETYQGLHQPIVTKALYDRVEKVIAGKLNVRNARHDFFLRRLLHCARCGYALIGERQKGHVYYRCHTRGCPTTTVREETVDTFIRRLLAPLALRDDEQCYLLGRLGDLSARAEAERQRQIRVCQIRLGEIDSRLTRLTDAYIDGTLEKELFESRKASLFLERRGLVDALAGLRAGSSGIEERLRKFLELAGSLSQSYETANTDEKRELVQIATSNRIVDGRNVAMTLREPFREVATRDQVTDGGPSQAVPRTLDQLIERLLGLLRATSAADKQV